MADREDMIRKVQALWRQADDAAATDEEKQAFETKARDLMAKYEIDEMVLQEASGTRESVVLSDIKIFDEDANTLVPDQRIILAHYIGTHNRCKSVIQRKPASVSVDGSPIKAGTYLTSVGFKSDVDMVRSLYQALCTDMVIAMMDEPTDHMKVSQRNNYYANFADGYANQIDRRLAAVARQVEVIAASSGNLLPVLRSKELEVRDFFSQMFPNLGKQKVTRFNYDPNAQARGKAAADRASLGGKGVGSGPKGAIGG